jgi:hypothetical protein
VDEAGLVFVFELVVELAEFALELGDERLVVGAEGAVEAGLRGEVFRRGDFLERGLDFFEFLFLLFAFGLELVVRKKMELVYWLGLVFKVSYLKHSLVGEPVDVDQTLELVDELVVFGLNERE